MTQWLDDTLLGYIFAAAVVQCKIPPSGCHHTFELHATHNNDCIYRVILGHINHVLDPASLFLSKRDIYSKKKRPQEQETGKFPDCSIYLPDSMSRNDPAVCAKC